MYQKIKVAEIQDFETVKSFYHHLIDTMGKEENSIGWEKDIYPSNELLRNAISNDELFTVEHNGVCIAAMIMNHEYNEEYSKVIWKAEASKEEITVIHALGILPEFQGRGIAKFLIKEAIRISAENGQKVIRLDVLARNIAAQRLYTKMGFQYLETIKMFYEDTGWTEFLLYEYIL